MNSIYITWEDADIEMSIVPVADMKEAKEFCDHYGLDMDENVLVLGW